MTIESKSRARPTDRITDRRISSHRKQSAKKGVVKASKGMSMGKAGGWRGIDSVGFVVCFLPSVIHY